MKTGRLWYHRARYNKPFIDRGIDGKYRIYVFSPFGRGLAEQVRGTKAYLTKENAEKKMKKVI